MPQQVASIYVEHFGSIDAVQESAALSHKFVFVYSSYLASRRVDNDVSSLAVVNLQSSLLYIIEQ